jgi:hypothetical protein
LVISRYNGERRWVLPVFAASINAVALPLELPNVVPTRVTGQVPIEVKTGLPLFALYVSVPLVALGVLI